MDWLPEVEEIRKHLARLRLPSRSAEHGQVEQVIDPRDTRRLPCGLANAAAPLRRARLATSTCLS